jgi:hypothetical protein
MDSEHYKKELDEFLSGVMDLIKESRGFAFSQRKAGKIILKMMILDGEVEVFSKHCGERGETSIADYWGAKAYAHGMVGKVKEGRAYFEKSRERRTGGHFAEMNQEFYS